ncbi:MAG TPA: FkbM family methyltransferase [Steroidobacteraceae bacterium]|nr:FkbM family methyltransferase [Steroidobacteraceae bacterium]
MDIISRAWKAAAVGGAIAAARARELRRASRPPVYLDIGARGGLSARWKFVHAARLIRPVFVEADPDEADRLKREYPGASVIPFALGDVDGESAELKITREPGRSSLLEPDTTVLEQFGAEPWEVVRRVPITLHRLDQVWPVKLAPPDFVKIDVQGFELRVLRGFGDLLNHVRGIELEVVLVPVYRQQPCLGEVVDFLRSSGFGLVRLASMGLYGGREMIEFNAFCVRQDRQRSPHVRMWKDVNGIGSLRRLVVWGY